MKMILILSTLLIVGTPLRASGAGFVDKQVEDIGNQWMFGPALMACPVGYYKARNRTVYFPRQCGWYNLYTNEYIEGGQTLVVDAPYEQIPVFVREGAIIPFGPEMEWSDEKPAELINLYVYAGRSGGQDGAVQRQGCYRSAIVYSFSFLDFCEKR